jgi:hypothetical protein
VRRRITLSKAAERTIRALSPQHHDEFAALIELLEFSLVGLERAGFVRPSEMFGASGFRYFDDRFPYLLFFEIVVDEDERESVAIQLIVPAFTDPRP